ncbi:MAG TPA: hypothetical protein DHU55_07400 [Blastocatellia bacterium]|nr:hypothetical protein [Blastocatellia bacterium]
MRRARLVSPLLASLALLGAGYLVGRTRRPVPPPLIVERRSDSPLNDVANLPTANSQAATNQFRVNSSGTKDPATPSAEGDVYLCGARTKKGTPCSRRVHGPVRCWQHKGMPAMLPQEKLLVKDQ